MVQAVIVVSQPLDYLHMFMYSKSMRESGIEERALIIVTYVWQSLLNQIRNSPSINAPLLENSK